MTYSLTTDELAKAELVCGDRVLLSGIVYTARDAAHKKIKALLDEDKPLPFEMQGAVVYYAGPTPAKPGHAVGSCGPTTSARMDSFAPALYDLGLCATIGKGERAQSVVDAIVRNGALYLCAVGGAGALISKHIVSSEEIAFSELGCESVKRMVVKDLPLTVAIDKNGKSIFAH